MCVFFFKQKTAYEMRISDWSSDVCSSDLSHVAGSCNKNEVSGCAAVYQRMARTARGEARGARPKCAAGGTLAADVRAGDLQGDRKSVGTGKSVSVRVDVGGRRVIKKKQK